MDIVFMYNLCAVDLLMLAIQTFYAHNMRFETSNCKLNMICYFFRFNIFAHNDRVSTLSNPFLVYYSRMC